MPSKLAGIVLVLVSLYSGQVKADIGAKDWMNYLTHSCEPTLSGKTKRLFGELDFWVHVSISMDNWIEFMRIEKPQENCAISNQTNNERYLQCASGYRDKLQWFARCKPVVVHMCRKAGGYC